MSDLPPELSDSTKLAIDRTRLAHERTLMAWVRTAVSLISFGFTVYKFFQALQDDQGAAHVHRLLGPREFALFLIAIGLISLVGATIQHRQEMQALRAEYPGMRVPRSLATMLGLLVPHSALWRCWRCSSGNRRLPERRCSRPANGPAKYHRVDSEASHWPHIRGSPRREPRPFGARDQYF